MSKEKGKKVSVKCPECDEKFILSDVTKRELKEGIDTTCPECEKKVEIYENNFIEFILTPGSIGSRIFANIYDNIIILFIFIGFIGSWYFFSNILSNDFVIGILFLLAFSFSIIAMFSYFTILDSKGRKTEGKKYLDLKVVTSNGKNLSKSRAFIRFLLYYILSQTGLIIISLFTMLFTKQKLSLHDIITSTRVISTKDK